MRRDPDATTSKIELRKLLRKEGLLQDPKQLALWSERILRELQESDEFINSKQILIYIETEGEVPTLDFIEKWQGEKNFVLPKVTSNSEMELRSFAPGHLTPGAFSILEPDDSCEIVRPDLLDLAIIPAVAFALETPIMRDHSISAFDRESAKSGKYLRLGRGKGYYDRLLSRLVCPKIGLCFPYRVLENIPQDPWDQVVDKCLF